MSSVIGLPTQHFYDDKKLIIKSGGVFGGGIVYIFGSHNVTAYTTSWKMLFNYESAQTIPLSQSLSPNVPTVLDTGAICFFTTTNAFTVVGGFKGGLAWYYNMTSSYSTQVYPVLTDNTTIFFSDGQFVIGADTFTGEVTSMSTYRTSRLRGYAIASGNETTTIFGATEDAIVFANQVMRSPSKESQGFFPGINVVGDCVASSRSYFVSVPAQCGSASNCSQAYCACLGGQWGNSIDSSQITKCGLSFVHISASTFELCFSTAMSCLTNAALDVNASDISVSFSGMCQEWAAQISVDYSLYYNATRLVNKDNINNNNKSSSSAATNLWAACNSTACAESSSVLDNISSALLSASCTFASVNRTPYFVPCVYTCPDWTCAASLAKCECTSRAVLSNLTVAANYDLTAVLPTTRLQIKATAKYGVPSGSCSDFSFASVLQFNWTVTSGALVQVLRSTGPTLSIPVKFLAPGTYSVSVVAAGLLSTQLLSSVFPVTVAAIDPSVRINGPTLVSSLNPFVLTIVVTNAASSSSYNWTCTSFTTDAQCPNLANSTAAALQVAAGAPAGRFTITYQYVANGITATAATTIDITFDNIPIVKVQQALGGGITSSSSSFGVNAFAYTQQIAVSSAVEFSSGNYTQSWSVNGIVVVNSSDATLFLSASTLLTTTVSAAKAGNYILNVITLTATSQANANITGNASVTVVVLEPVGASLSVAKQGDATATSAQSLTDSLAFTVSVNPSLTVSNVPFASLLQTSVVYFKPVYGGALSLLTQLSSDGSALVGKAPLIPGNSTSAVAVTFGLQVSLSGVVVATANTTFGIVILPPSPHRCLQQPRPSLTRARPWRR